MRITSTSMATAALQVATNQCTITKIQGFKNAANDRYLQLHDTKITPAANAVPVRQWPIYGTAPFGESFINLPVTLSNGACLVVSSTNGTYTASAETVEVTVDGISTVDVTGVSTAGDYTTAAGATLATIWAEGSGPKRLLRLEFTALSDYGAVLYAKLYAQASIVAGTLPITQWTLARNTSKDVVCNTVPLAQKSDGTIKQGCYIQIDATSGGWAGDYAGTSFAIKGTYK